MNKSMVTFPRFLRTLGWLLFLTAALAACAGQPERLWLKSPGWSRAQFVDNTRVGDPVPITLDDQGNIYIFVISGSSDVSRLRVIALDRQANVVWDHTFEEIELTVSKKPWILWDGEALQLFWISGRGLYNAQVAVTGRLLGPATLLSGEAKVGHYDVARNLTGSIAVWYSGTRDQPGLYTIPLSDRRDDAILVDAKGILPDIQYDDTGTLHVIWAHNPQGRGDKPFFYASYPDGGFRPGEESIVVAPQIFGTTVLEGPILGLDGQYAYIFWSMTFYSGFEAGTAETHYVYFPKGQSSSVSPDYVLSVPYLYNLSYQDFQESALKAGARVPLGSGFFGGGTYITQVKADPDSEQELVIAFHARLAYLMRKTKSQVSAAFFQDGAPTGYQQLSFTLTSSASPAIFSDDEGQLYLTWLEKGELPGWAVYFASTAPGIKKGLSSLTWDDVGRLTAETFFGLLTGALFIPIGLAWLLPSMLVLALTSKIQGVEENLTSFGAIVSFALALIILWGTKLGVLPGILEYVPFSAWIPNIPSWLNSPLRLGVPVLVATLALLAAWYYTFRKKESSIFVFMIIYAVVDGILTMSVYGVLVLAAF